MLTDSLFSNRWCSQCSSPWYSQCSNQCSSQFSSQWCSQCSSPWDSLLPSNNNLRSSRWSWMPMATSFRFSQVSSTLTNLVIQSSKQHRLVALAVAQPLEKEGGPMPLAMSSAISADTMVWLSARSRNLWCRWFCASSCSPLAAGSAASVLSVWWVTRRSVFTLVSIVGENLEEILTKFEGKSKSMKLLTD